MTAWAIDTAIGVTLVMLLVLAVRRPVARHFGAGWAYALWLLPLLRMLMPPIDLFGNAAASLPSYTMILLPSAEAAVPAADAAAAIDWLALLVAVWLGGAGAFALWQQSTYSAFVMSLGPGRCSQPPQHGGVPVVECDAVEGPVAIGFLKRRIVVPPDFIARYSPAERRLALDHELTHHRRGDLWWNLAALAVLALNWFNPVAWLAFRAFREDQELACDAAVTARISPQRRQDYARALVKAASAPGQIATCPLNHVGQLKERLRMMREHRLSRSRTAGGLTALFVLAGTGFAIAAPGLAREAPMPAPQLVIRADAPNPLLAEREVATLQARCAAGIEERALWRRAGADGGGLIVCSNGSVIDDPEVQAIVALATERTAAAAAAVSVEASTVATRVAQAATVDAVPEMPAPPAMAAAPRPFGDAEPIRVRASVRQAEATVRRARRYLSAGNSGRTGLSAEELAELRTELARVRAEIERELAPHRVTVIEAAVARTAVRGLGELPDADAIAAAVERQMASLTPQIEPRMERRVVRVPRSAAVPPPPAPQATPPAAAPPAPSPPPRVH
jgi:bla regulator protein blaR1